eukprot:TRINITY_DN773085_c0_g1_i1.p1 TRINITY_DN773085_c0_g1~~TRINITY_DN773085_c0_g1_i1.p1  ORF type:complete len:541 (-),score=172.26 TRINITY_DN773085_c0_g1_i1:310-1896(-)
MSGMLELVLSTLPENEKDRMFQFMLQNDCSFYKDESCGSWITNVRFIPESMQPKKETERKQFLASGANKRASRPPAQMQKIVAALNKNQFDCGCYPKFSSLISSRNSLTPKKMNLAAVLKEVNTIYDERYIRDTSDLKDDYEEDSAASPTERLSNIFPVFVMDYYQKRFGLGSLVDQKCWDLLFNVHSLRKSNLDVEIFARFLEEYYDPDNLLFYLHVRHKVFEEIGNAASLSQSRRIERPESTNLTYRQCVNVARSIFASEYSVLLRAFLDLLEQYMEGSKRGRTDSRTIDLPSFLHLALIQYHESRPADVPAPAIAESSEMQPVEPVVAIHTKEEQERLFREAELQYESRIREIPTSPSGSPPANAGTPMSPANPTAIPMGNEFPEKPMVMGEPSEELLASIGSGLEEANEEYLERVLPSDNELPEALLQEISKEVRMQLEGKVDSVMAAIMGVEDSEPVTDLEDLQQAFQNLMQFQTVDPSHVQAFCRSVLEVPEVRKKVEPLVALLITYAKSKLKDVMTQSQSS